MNQAKIFITFTFLLAFTLQVSAQQGNTPNSNKSNANQKTNKASNQQGIPNNNQLPQQNSNQQESSKPTPVPTQETNPSNKDDEIISLWGYNVRWLSFLVLCFSTIFTLAITLFNYRLIKSSFKISEESRNIAYNSKQIDLIRMFNDRFTDLIEKPIVNSNKNTRSQNIIKGKIIISRKAKAELDKNGILYFPNKFEIENNDKSENKWDEKTFLERFWGLQYEQYHWWRKGLISNDFFEIWMEVRRINFELGFESTYHRFSRYEYRKSFKDQADKYKTFTQSKKFFLFFCRLHDIGDNSKQNDKDKWDLQNYLDSEDYTENSGNVNTFTNQHIKDFLDEEKAKNEAFLTSQEQNSSTLTKNSKLKLKWNGFLERFRFK